MSEFCKDKINQVYGAPRTPTTQGLVEPNNRTVKENMNNIINENNDEKANWCKILNEAGYKKNIVEHSATGRTPYEAVFGILPRKESQNAGPTEEKPGNERSPIPNKRKHEEICSQRKKLKTDINEKQFNSNTKIKESRRKAPKFHADEFVCIKIDRVDKTSPLHHNVLIGKNN